MRYDYSLDVGQSMESEEELKARQEKEKQQAQENAPASGEELSAKRIEEEIKQEAEKAGSSEEVPEEKVESNPDSEDQSNAASEEPSKETEKEDISVKEISFEKAELIEEHQKAQKTIEDWEKESEEDEDSEEKPKDELEEDVNELIEDSFKEEQQSYMQNNGPKEYEEPKKSYAIPIALAVIFICAVIFGFVYFMYPEKATAAATVDVPSEEVNLEPVVPEKTVAGNITKQSANASKQKVTSPVANATKEVPKVNATKPSKKPAKSDEQMLSDVLLSGLN